MLTQIVLEVLVILVHYDAIHRDALLVTGLHVPIEFAQYDRPQRRQRQIEQITDRSRFD